MSYNTIIIIVLIWACIALTRSILREHFRARVEILITLLQARESLGIEFVTLDHGHRDKESFDSLLLKLEEEDLIVINRYSRTRLSYRLSPQGYELALRLKKKMSRA